MGYFFARQPNGRICRFSTIVDTVTDFNMTDEDYAFRYGTFGLTFEEAMREFALTAKSFDMVSEYFVPNNMTQEEFDEIMEKMKTPPDDEEGKKDPMQKEKCYWCKTFGQVPLRGFTVHGCESTTVKYCPLCGRVLDPEIIKAQAENEDKVMQAVISQSDVILRAAHALREAKSHVLGENSLSVQDLDRQINKLEGMRDEWNKSAAQLMQMKL